MRIVVLNAHLNFPDSLFNDPDRILSVAAFVVRGQL
jgi:hypothetical protein